MILKPDCTYANNIFCCLAVIGSDNIRNVFYELEKNPLPWREKLHVNPLFYAVLGGWTFRRDGRRIDLNDPKCYALIKEDREDDCALAT